MMNANDNNSKDDVSVGDNNSTDDAGDSSPQASTTSASQMEKDPLGIGVPLPIVQMERNLIPKNVLAFENNDTSTTHDDSDDLMGASSAGIVSRVMTQDAPKQGTDPLLALQAAAQEERPGSFAVRGPGRTHPLTHAEQSGDLEQGTTTTESGGLESSTLSVMVQATLVNEEDKPVVHASPVSNRWWSPRSALLVLLVLTSVIVGLVIGVVKLKEDPNDMEEMSFSPNSSTTIEEYVSTLQRVQEEGVVRCGFPSSLRKAVSEILKLRKKRNQTDDYWQQFPISNNFSPKLCQSVAAAALGPNASYEMVPYDEDQKLHVLQNQKADLLFPRTPVSMQLDVSEKDAGLAFTVPLFYAGVSVTGDPAFVQCADNNLQTYGHPCTDMRLCMDDAMLYYDEIIQRIPKTKVVSFNKTGAAMPAFLQGNCNVIATESPHFVAAGLQALGYQGELAVGQRQYTPDMFSITTLDRDPEWADFVNTVLMALLAAEEAGITQERAEKMGTTDLFGEDHKDMLIHAVQANGNFGEFYDYVVPLTGRNAMNNGSTGLLATPTLGRVGHPDAYLRPNHGGTIEAVQKQGTLRCGIRGGRPGFASWEEVGWTGVDTDYCRAVAASLFDGDSSKVEFYDIDSHNETFNGFVLLHSGEIDVYAGATWTVPNSVKESATGVGYSFSQPYFFGPPDSGFEENLAMVTRQEDAQWSSFVYWTAQSLVYAEEQGIQQQESNQMPLVFVFGSDLQRMFRDAIHSVGNYQEVYQQNLQAILPRAGRNQLNRLEENAPMRYIPPGFDFQRQASSE